MNIEQIKQSINKAEEDLIWLAENVYEEHIIENQWVKRNTDDIGYSILPNNQKTSGKGGWYPGFFVLQVSSWITILAQYEEIELLRNPWISVEDELPKEDSLVVAIHNYNWCEPDGAICIFLHGRFHLHGDAIIAENHDGGAQPELDVTITHWMPLPQAPKEQSK